jgi:hypothetical protein
MTLSLPGTDASVMLSWAPSGATGAEAALETRVAAFEDCGTLTAASLNGSDLGAPRLLVVRMTPPS